MPTPRSRSAARTISTKAFSPPPGASWRFRPTVTTCAPDAAIASPSTCGDGYRAVPSSNYPTSVSWNDIWKERRLEFAMEGDRWYDYVRVSYYDADFCVNELTNQKRNAYWGLNDLYKEYYTSGTWSVDASSQGYDSSVAAPNVNVMLRADSETGKKYFALPMSAEDVLYNPNLGSNVEGVHVDVRSTYSY